MQNIRQCLQRLAQSSLFFNKTELLTNALKPPYAISACFQHAGTRAMLGKTNRNQCHWLDYNDNKFPIQGPNEERRPAYVCHVKHRIKYSPKKMWYIAAFVRGITVDEAVKQLSFLHKKGAAIAKEVILEAQKLAVEEHNVEYKSNLWVAESFATNGGCIKGIRKHARRRIGTVHYRYCNYYVRLEEGKPPEHYYLPVPKSGDEMLDSWMQQMRKRKISNSL